MVVRPRRLVHGFDFEERKLGNFEDLPMHWYVIGRSAETADPDFSRQPLHQRLIHKEGFPAYTVVRFDTRHAASGRHSFHLGLNGHNAGAFLEGGALSATPGADYRITARVRTAGLEHAAARVIAYFIDEHGREIAGSRSSTGLIHGEVGWQKVSLSLSGDFPEAASIGLQVEVRQPTPDADNPLGKQQIVLQDIRGGAWFDDINVWQLSHVSLGSQSPVNIVRGANPPRFDADVRDLTDRRLRARMTVYDLTGRPVARATRSMGAGTPATWGWRPPLKQYGWYLADLQVFDEKSADGKPRAAGTPGTLTSGTGQEADRRGASTSHPMRGEAGKAVARTLSAVLWLPEDAWPTSGGDRARFVLDAAGADDAALNLLPDMLDASGLHAAAVSAWRRRTTLKTLDRRQSRLDGVLRSVLRTGRSITMSLGPLPNELADKAAAGSPSPLMALHARPGVWMPYLAPLITRQGGRISRWRLGRAGGAGAGAGGVFDGEMAKVRPLVERRLDRLLPQARLVWPWRLDQVRPTAASNPSAHAAPTFSLDVPPGVAPANLTDYLASWRKPPSQAWLTLREPPADQLSRPRRARDLALRMVRAWQGGAAGLVLPRPWTRAIDGPGLVPDSLLGVFVSVAHRLAGRRVVGRLPLGPGLVGLIFNGPAGGMLVVWNRKAAPQDARLDMHLGPAPTVSDLWGNRRAIPSQSGRQQLALKRWPQFITGIDTPLALLRASFKASPAFVAATSAPHTLTVTLTNPRPRPIRGTLRLSGPEGWRIHPARHEFSLASGATLHLPVRVTLPFAASAGTRRLTARLDLSGERRRSFMLSTTVRVGLRDMTFTPTATLSPTGRPGMFDVELTCRVTNGGQKARSWSMFADLAGQPRQARQIGRLKPGASVVRRFHFRKLTRADLAHALRSGLRQLNGPAMLNKLLPLNQPDADGAPPAPDRAPRESGAGDGHT